MLVGEQPGDEEDIQGLPFVGPAGKLLDRAMAEAGIPSKKVYVTNAVKHFKFTLRGKKRLHQSPSAREIKACKPWLLAEIKAVKPQLILCLGATAAKSFLGAGFALTKNRGQVQQGLEGVKILATYHPSAALRAPDHDRRRELYQAIVKDLKNAAAMI
jgi:DNA polymerase